MVLLFTYMILLFIGMILLFTGMILLFTGMILLDLQKAFDTVDHKVLCDQLVVIGVGFIHI